MIGLLTIMAIPVTVSVAQGIKGDKKKNTPELPPYFTLFSESKQSVFLDRKQVVLRDNRLFLKTTGSKSHPFGGYIRPFIDSEARALVTTTGFDPPALGWIYIDKATRQVKYGTRVDAGEGIHGNFTYDDFGLNLENRYKFLAVKEEDGEWALYSEEKDGTLPGLEGKQKVQLRLVQEAIEELIPTK